MGLADCGHKADCEMFAKVKYGQPVPQLMLARHVHETEYRRGKNYVEGKKASF